jgi:hypothetical protein
MRIVAVSVIKVAGLVNEQRPEIRKANVSNDMTRKCRAIVISI